MPECQPRKVLLLLSARQATIHSSNQLLCLSQLTCVVFVALDIVPNDPKSLFRRCQALEKLGSFEEAYRDVSHLLRVDPKNSAIQPILRRLNPIIQDKVSACYMV